MIKSSTPNPSLRSTETPEVRALLVGTPLAFQASARDWDIFLLEPRRCGPGQEGEAGSQVGPLSPSFSRLCAETQWNLGLCSWKKDPENCSWEGTKARAWTAGPDTVTLALSVRGQGSSGRGESPPFGAVYVLTRQTSALSESLGLETHLRQKWVAFRAI